MVVGIFCLLLSHGVRYGCQPVHAVIDIDIPYSVIRFLVITARRHPFNDVRVAIIKIPLTSAVRIMRPDTPVPVIIVIADSVFAAVRCLVWMDAKRQTVLTAVPVQVKIPFRRLRTDHPVHGIIAVADSMHSCGILYGRTQLGHVSKQVASIVCRVTHRVCS